MMIEVILVKVSKRYKIRDFMAERIRMPHSLGSPNIGLQRGL